MNAPTSPVLDNSGSLEQSPKITAKAATFSILHLALADFRHDWRNFACLVLALAAILAPLLVLGGLKAGIVSTMREKLIADPANLEVLIVGSYSLKPDWLRELAARPDVGFMIPRTRSLAATIDLIAENGKSLAAVELAPSKQNDPLLENLAPPVGLDVILLSKSAASRLGVKEGDQIIAQVVRTQDGKRQAMRRPMHVQAVLEERSFTRDGVFASLDFLVNIEDFRDGLTASLEENRLSPSERSYASARLYAKNLDDVAPLAAHLRQQGMEVRTRADDIAAVKAIDRTLNLVLLVVASLSIGGYLLSLASSLWANVDRKRRELALLRLIGFPGAAIVAFPAIGALLISIIGVFLSIIAAFGVSALFNALFAEYLARDEIVCRLTAPDLAFAAGLTIILALVASILGGYRAFSIDPAESLRDI